MTAPILSPRTYLATLKDVPCMDCGGYWPGHPEVMDFDHRDPSAKSFTIGSGSGRSLPELVDEVAKCDVVCAVCHRMRTKRQRAEARGGRESQPSRAPSTGKRVVTELRRLRDFLYADLRGIGRTHTAADYRRVRQIVAAAEDVRAELAALEEMLREGPALADGAWSPADSPLAGFLPGVFVKDEEGGRIEGRAVFDAYTEWATSKGVPVRERLTRQALSRALEERGVAKRRSSRGVVFVGIRSALDKFPEPTIHTPPTGAPSLSDVI